MIGPGCAEAWLVYRGILNLLRLRYAFPELKGLRATGSRRLQGLKPVRGPGDYVGAEAPTS
jgi:hypothetical protein